MSEEQVARVYAQALFDAARDDGVVEPVRDCVGVMCGHIHTAADKMFGDVHYLNSGDWVESLTAIVEHADGRFELIEFADFRKIYPLEAETGEHTETPAVVAAAPITALPQTQPHTG